MLNNIAIKIENLTKVYKLYNSPIDRLKEAMSPLRRKYHHDFTALDNVSFEVKKGETLGIIGKNGSGKSTLLKIITGVLTPTSGSITVNGKISALLELGAGFNPELTGIENVYFNGTLMGYTREEVDAKLDEILLFADIGEFVHQPVKTYSSGMFVRLAFAVAINVDPDILIIDEALSVGDEAFQRKCYARIIDFKKRGKTILFVSHSVATIVELTSNGIIMNNGELLLKGNPKKMISVYQKMINMSNDKIASFIDNIKSGNILSTPVAEKHIECKGMDITSYYDMNIKSNSFISYEKRGAEIYNTKICTKDGDKVNVLVRGEVYIYSYSVKFDIDAYNVRFGMLIKTPNGSEIAGLLSHTPVDGIEFVNKGQVVDIAYKFRCTFLPGGYFMNSGVAGTVDKEEIFLHRVIDVLMFKVQDEPELLSTGIVDISIENYDAEVIIH